MKLLLDPDRLLNDEDLAVINQVETEEENGEGEE